MFEYLDDPHPPNPDDLGLEVIRARTHRIRRRRRRLVAGVVLAVSAALLIPTIVLAAPGGDHETKVSAPPSESGVRAVVVLAPTCPVEGIGDGCGPQPTDATVVVRSRSSGAIAATVRAGSDGRFQVALPSGEYELTVETPEVEHCPSLGVTVAAGRYADLTIRCDTGIR